MDAFKGTTAIWLEPRSNHMPGAEMEEIGWVAWDAASADISSSYPARMFGRQIRRTRLCDKRHAAIHGTRWA